MKIIICKFCGASFVPETDLQRLTNTCKECLIRYRIILPEEETKCKEEK